MWCLGVGGSSIAEWRFYFNSAVVSYTAHREDGEGIEEESPVACIAPE